MDRYAIPGMLDEPQRFGLWTIDEFVAMAVPFVAGIMVSHVLWGIFFAIMGWWGLRKAKAGRAVSWVLHLAYWYLPVGLSGVRAVPPSYLRLMAG